MPANSFSSWLGYIYIFNLIVGTGTLALPRVFQDAGYLLATFVIAVLSFFSYMAFTYVVEGMSVANAILSQQEISENTLYEQKILHQNQPNLRDVVAHENQDAEENDAKIDFEIRRKVELGTMASMFLGKWGVYVFYFCLAVYLYGDLAIYSTVVPKSLMNVLCSISTIESNDTCWSCNVTKNDPCWDDAHPFFTRFNVYRLIVVVFALLIGPFVFFNISKTKYLQILTSISRWISFVLMIGLASKILLSGKGAGHPPKVKMENFANLFGISVYAFMCHHSLPSVITPMMDKSKIFPLTSLVYLVILAFYATISLTGAFAFGNLQDIYTLNFLSLDNQNLHGILLVLSTAVDYFLALFPVFTLTTNFPIVGITLRNNLISLLCNTSVYDKTCTNLQEPSVSQQNDDNSQEINASDVNLDEKSALQPTCKKSHVLQRLVIPIVVILPPIFISICSDNVELLASVTGSYAGVGVQYFLPALLAWGARKNLVSRGLCNSRPWLHKSPFGCDAWIFVLFCWATVSVTIVTVNHFCSGF